MGPCEGRKENKKEKKNRMGDFTPPTTPIPAIRRHVIIM